MHRISLTSAILLILSAGLIQATSFDLVMLFGVKPDVLFVITVFAALTLYRNDVLKCSAMAGMVKDVTSSAVFGSYTLSFILIGFFICAHQNKFYRERPFIQMALSFLSYICMGVCVLLINLVAYRQSRFFYNGFSLVFKGALYTCLVAPLVFLIASKVLRVKLAQTI
jgi:rod shape-determining protein MreD